MKMVKACKHLENQVKLFLNQAIDNFDNISHQEKLSFRYKGF